MAADGGEDAPEDGGNIIPFVPKRAGKPYRPRHDGFTPARQKIFFKVLKKSGCIQDACRACGISRVTVRRWRDRWEEFDDKVEAALAIASVELDMIAWKRATEGAEEKVYRDGKLVSTRVKPSDSMLRLLMQGADPKKYGRMGQMPKRALVKKLRKEAEAAAKKKMRSDVPTLIASLKRSLEIVRKRKLKAGYCEGPDGGLVPPGWKLVPDPPLLPAPEGGDDKPRE